MKHFFTFIGVLSLLTPISLAQEQVLPPPIEVFADPTEENNDVDGPMNKAINEAKSRLTIGSRKRDPFGRFQGTNLIPQKKDPVPAVDNEPKKGPEKLPVIPPKAREAISSGIKIRGTDPAGKAAFLQINGDMQNLRVGEKIKVTATKTDPNNGKNLVYGFNFILHAVRDDAVDLKGAKGGKIYTLTLAPPEQP